MREQEKASESKKGEERTRYMRREKEQKGIERII